MPLILHISDLHLVSPDASPALDDHKAGLVPAAGRSSHFQALRLTFQRLVERLLKEGRHLDAIVVSGDIADKNGEGGYTAFMELLESLNPVRPSADRIVVVPGNHDVTAGLTPGDAKRYDRFVKFIRGTGFVTPMLNGVDISGAGSSLHLASFAGIQIIPLDSSAYSQVRMDIGIRDSIWNNLEAMLKSHSSELTALKGLRIADAARVDGSQLEFIRQLLATATPKEKQPVRILVLHHHLLPVSPKEEIKSFESLSNLGLVRQFLRDQAISIVLHGHKHTEFSYMDYVSTYAVESGNPWPVRIVAGAAASSRDLERHDVIRLLDINVNSAFIELERIGIAIPGTSLSAGRSQSLDFRAPESPLMAETQGCVLIDGTTVEAVYRELLGKLDGRPNETDHVVCRIEKSPDIENIARLYPGLRSRGSSSERASTSAPNTLEEFQEVVRWWQFPIAPVTPLDQPAFTHGSRIRRYHGHLDQIEAVIETLKVRRETSRALIVLLSPEADKIADHEVEFPSFCLVQFRIRDERSDRVRTLNCTAYFRKQEVRYWWLVNLAELTDLQHRICDALRQRGDQDFRNIVPGSITTIAARAHAGESAPKVQVPRVDRYFSMYRERLFAMVNALFWEQMPNRAEYAHQWRTLFEELSPPSEPDRDGTPVAQDGLEYLKVEIERHLQAGELVQNGPLVELHRALEQLLAANREFALIQSKEDVTPEKYGRWRTLVMQWIGAIVQCSQKCITTSPTERF